MRHNLAWTVTFRKEMVVHTSLQKQQLVQLSNHAGTNATASSSVQSLSPVQLFATPWTAARRVSLSITNSQSLFKLMSIESVMPSNHLILCRPVLLLPSILPSIRIFSNFCSICFLLLCHRLLQFQWLEVNDLYYSFQMSEIQTCLSWVLHSGSHKEEIKVLDCILIWKLDQRSIPSKLFQAVKNNFLVAVIQATCSLKVNNKGNLCLFTPLTSKIA